mgnify:CR=1 FL=1
MRKHPIINLKNQLIELRKQSHENELNEQLLYVVDYDNKYGNFKYISDDELTYNEVAEINTKRATNMNIDSLNLVKMCNVIEINDLDVLRKEDDPNKFDYAKIMSLVIILTRSELATSESRSTLKPPACCGRFGV